ncbi:MAG: FAD-binding protein [Chlamydiales bacterium]|nr:FAD-binding protein [Chlamydiales bacterium]
MERVIEILKHELKSEVRYDQISKRMYSLDASIYDVEPLAILIPRSKQELVHAIEICSQYSVSIIPRGAATGIAGGCLGRGLVVDTSVHLNRVLEIDYTQHTATIQPGVVADRLNEMLAPHNLYFAPEISTSNRATIGGMVAANAAGANSLKVGKMQDHVIELELALWNGQLVRFSSVDKATWKEKLKDRGIEGKIYRHLEHIRKEFAQDIRNDFPKTPRRASGYSLDALLDDTHINVAALICGSEGTLGFITEIKVKISPIPQHKTLVVVGYRDMTSALVSSNEWLDLKPSAVEMIDKKIITAGRSSPAMRNKLDWLEKDVDTLIMWEFEEKSQEACSLKAQELLKRAPNAKEITDKEQVQHVWDLRKAGLGLLLSQRGYSRAIAFIEDVAVPPAEVATFVNKLDQILASVGKDVGIYGHIGAGCLHVRPFIDLRRPEELATMQHITDDVAKLLQECGGVFSGEHGDGRARSWTNQMMFGPRLYEAMCQVKRAFDPYGIMNPGKIVASQSETPQGLLQNLKLHPAMPIKEFSTYMDFSREGGFALAVDLCNGNGQCRKKEGVMCPSFQVTHDERDSTRGRAQALRGFIHGQVSEKELNSDEFGKVMDLCIQCKGCKTECPSQIDMAKMKSEYLHHEHQKKSPAIRDRLFGHVTDLFKMTSGISGLVNFCNKSRLARKVLERFGITADRPLPVLAQKRFSELFVQKQNTLPQVVLYIDSFTEFLSPHIGLDAVKVLESLGYLVIVPSWTCCGRPLVSKGFLPQARKKISQVVELLYPYAEQGISVVAIEPSCMSMLVDEIRDFHLDHDKVELVTKAVQPLDKFLLAHKEQLQTKVTPYDGKVLVHGHCHQKALFGMQSELTLLKSTCAPNVSEIPSGCCGMAGSFGYEKEHAQFSKKIGELTLFPALRARPDGTVIIASGNSCRSQIEDGVHVTPLHFVEFIAQRLK